MNRQLVFVHGRAQQHKDASALKAEWLDALHDGLAKNGLRLPIAESDIRFPYYGDTLYDLGRRIPDDVAVVGYDNWDIYAADCRPPLTTVDLNLEQLGATAVEHLLAAIDGHPRSGVIRLPGRLVVRESTGPAPARPDP